MIEVNIQRDLQGRVIFFQVTGHAEYAEFGKDVVCGAVSALAQTAILGLEEVAGISPEVEINEGSLICMLSAGEAANDRGQAILETVILGLKEIEQDYGDYLRVIEQTGEDGRRCRE